MSKIILLPGALGYAGQFENLISELDLLNCEAKAFDIPGHGLKPLSANTIPLMAEDFLGELESKGINEPVNIFGHSLGGYLGLYLCLNFPHRVNRLFTLGTKWSWTEALANKETSMLNPEKMEQKIPAYVQQLKSHHSNDWKDVVNLIVFLMHDLGQNQYLNPEKIKEISHEIRISLGDRDNMVSIEETVDEYRVLSKGQLQIYPNTLHPFQKVDVKKLAVDLNDFF